MKCNLKSDFSSAWNYIGVGVAAAYVILTMAVAISRSPVRNSQHIPVLTQFEVLGQVMNLEIVETAGRQSQGLMYRRDLAANQGMLFAVHPPRKVHLWTKNMEFQLDMIFLRRGRVVAIVSDAPPCRKTPCPTYSPDVLVDQVVELKGGRASELGVHVGSEFILHQIKSKPK